MQPNFLFIITDQQRADHLGCYGNTVVRTPHIDALARRGFRSERFYVANPVCSPNRASIMTGRMPSLHRLRHNGIELSFTETTFPQLLMDAGYRTALNGKSHLQCIHAAPAAYPTPEERLSPEARRPDGGRHGQEQEKTWENDPEHDLDLPYYGFERVRLSIMHADRQQGHWRRWLRQQLPDADKLIGPDNAIPTPEYELVKSRQAWRTQVPEELYPNHWITDETIKSIRDSVHDGKPFFIQCSYPDPHHPFTPPGKYWSMYSPDDIPLPASYGAAHTNPPRQLQWNWDAREAGTGIKNGQPAFACTEREAREAIALNYGTISQIDDGVGRIMAELERLGIADNTVVIFTADHGDLMGDHQMLLKGPLHYQGLIRVPFIWMDPRAATTTDAAARNAASQALLQSTDIGPSVLESAGLARFNGMQGRSVLPLVAGETDGVRESVLVEDDRQRHFYCFETRVRMRSLVTDTHRITINDETEWGELHDLKNDPLELVNLWDDPGARTMRADLVQALARKMIA
ncbi:MAG: sulfatase-like hydrolase/transferase, partial [Variovorax sp.]